MGAEYGERMEMGQGHSIGVAGRWEGARAGGSGGMKALREGKVVGKEEDGVLHLTEDGEELARAVYEKHVFFQRMFMQLGVDESVAGRDACLVEHAVSDEVFEKLKERYDHVLAEGGQ